MPSEITFGKDRYYLNNDMESWCKQHIGHGGWTYASPKDWRGMDDRVWVMHSMFGNTTFAFKHDRDALAFTLKWA